MTIPCSAKSTVKKIYINGKFLAQPITGTQRYAREVLAAIDRQLSQETDRDLVLEVLAPPSAKEVPSYSNIRVTTVGRMRGTAWEQIELPRHCRGHLLVTLSGGAPILHPRNVITIHDAAVFSAPAGFTPAFRLWYRFLYRRMAQTAVHILTNSQFSRSEIVKWCRANPERVSVTYHGSDHFSSVKADCLALRRLGISGDYVLAVSSHNPNKNFARTCRALVDLKQSGIEVIVAGGHNRKVFADGGPLPTMVRTVGYVSNAELKALYENARCFVYASLYEGFGLPPLEALSAGCPIVVSNTASLPEICGEAAVLCDPYSPEDIARAVGQVLNAPPADRNQLKSFAARYSWGNCARETLHILSSLQVK